MQHSNLQHAKRSKRSDYEGTQHLVDEIVEELWQHFADEREVNWALIEHNVRLWVDKSQSAVRDSLLHADPTQFAPA